MKTMFPSISMRTLMRYFSSMARHTLFLVWALGFPLAVGAADGPRMFGTPAEAVVALGAAAADQDFAALTVLFGPGAEDLENPDRVQATNEFRAFASAMNESHRIVNRSDTQCVLEVGAQGWVFPVPIVQQDGQWFFDAAAGRDEVLNRRIGKNELSTLEVIRAYVDAQREYAFKDRDGDEVLEYAQRFSSSPGQKDGLHWLPDLDGEISPLGPLVVQANAEGYSKGSRNQGVHPEPFHGYYFRILSRQSKSAPGGRYSYIINGNMIGGFALVAWPAEYGDSGIMTFIVNQQGRVYQKDLGPKSGDIARKMSAYAPDATWTTSRD
jgi:hypothetical protein